MVHLGLLVFCILDLYQTFNMNDRILRSKLIKLAEAEPSVRAHILPLLQKEGTQENPYSLYKKPGWEQVQSDIKEAVENAEEYLESVYKNGRPMDQAIQTYITPILNRHRDFGTTDMEVFLAISEELQAFMVRTMRIRTY